MRLTPLNTSVTFNPLPPAGMRERISNRITEFTGYKIPGDGKKFMGLSGLCNAGASLEWMMRLEFTGELDRPTQLASYSVI